MPKALHAPHQHIKRSAGKSACASAAYRSGEKIHDPRTGQTFDYTRKQRVDGTLVLGWQGTAAELWQAVELAEARKDAKLADEHEISLPQCMTVEHRAELAVKLAQVLAEEYGKDSGKLAPAMACIHNLRPPKPGEARTDNPHVHVMLATRAADPATVTGLAAEKLPCHWSKAKRDTHGLAFESQSDRCTRIRALVADTINRQLLFRGYDMDANRVEHRSYADIGLEQIPQKHLGPAATAMERRGVQTELGDHNRRVVDLTSRREALQASAAQVRESVRSVSAEIHDLAEYRDALQQRLAEQRRASVLAREAKATEGMTPEELRKRAQTWRSLSAPATPEMKKQRQILDRLEYRHADGWCKDGTAADELRQAEKALDEIRGKTPWLKKVLPFARPAELREATERVAKLEHEVAKLPKWIEQATERLEQMRTRRQSSWEQSRGDRHAAADYCDAEAREAEARERAEQQRRAERLEQIDALRQERVAKYGYDPMAESHQEYQRRMEQERMEREARAAEAARELRALQAKAASDYEYEAEPDDGPELG